MFQTNTNLFHSTKLTIGSTTTLFLISIFVFSIAACKPSHESTTRLSENTKKPKGIGNTGFRHDEWQTTSLNLIQMGEQDPLDVSARNTVFRSGVANDGSPISVIAFEIPATNQFWIGPEQDAYLKSGNQIMGVRFNADLTYLYWRESMPIPTPAANSAPNSLDEKVAAFESSIDLQTLFSADVSDDVDVDQITEIESRVGSSFFLMGPEAANMGEMEIGSIVARNNNLKIGITNLSTRESADVWVDIHSRKVTKVIKNRIRTYPVPIEDPDSAKTKGSSQQDRLD